MMALSNGEDRVILAGFV